MRIELLYSDPALLVCVKPAGVLSQSDGAMDLSSILKAQEKRTFAQPAHRLDREAGGLVAVAGTQWAAAALSDSLAAGQWEKTYLAVVRGSPELPEDELRDLLFHDVRRNKTYVVVRPRRGVREAVLCYRALAQQDGLTLLSVKLLTGRTHQIRVQFSSRGMPLQGDGRYGGGSGPLALWSARLSLPHPGTGERMTFCAPPPDDSPWDLFSDVFTEKPTDWLMTI